MPQEGVWVCNGLYVWSMAMGVAHGVHMALCGGGGCLPRLCSSPSKELVGASDKAVCCKIAVSSLSCVCIVVFVA